MYNVSKIATEYQYCSTTVAVRSTLRQPELTGCYVVYKE